MSKDDFKVIMNSQTASSGTNTNNFALFELVNLDGDIE